MKKIDLRMNEQLKYKIIKELVESNGNKNSTALKLGCTRRTVDRMIKGYKEQGKVFFRHGNRNRKPVTAVDQMTSERICNLYIIKFYDANFTHFTELLTKHEDIHYSVSTISNILKNNEILSPKARKATKKKYRDELKKKLDNTNNKKEIQQIEYKMVELD